MIKIFLDGADKDTILRYNRNPEISGFTTNPTLMRKAGVTDYERFAKELLEQVTKPISFEVFADDFEEMERQARKIASWGENVYVKIPITNTKGYSSSQLVRKLSYDGIKINLTAVFLLSEVIGFLFTADAIISIFMGRIHDASFYPIILSKDEVEGIGNASILWASTREVQNIYQANEMGFDIITVSPEIYEKRKSLYGKKLTQYSLETVQQFHADAQAAGYTL